ncbi:glycosyl transferase family 4 [Nitrosospira sp. Nsp5]|uniref:Glycosyl transferase 4-like domain-containing protein n=2 Tax=Nitrosomonadaceae TaxID=206379 RepID=A0ABY0T637_9PROT|nr:glycosyl transferase family 4 [Nitrosospira sp. Nsp5]SDQ30305.1 Glycosyl transferase 4-like domain-containing protein [Nitrosospira multiformis]
MIAFHFPPMRGSSGILRTLKFSRYLPEFDWEPIILTAHPRTYANTSNDQVAEISDRVTVYRAFGFDTSRHLSFMRRYPGLLALPDRWVSWSLGAIPMGLYLIRKYRPDVIWSTYPIATAHLIGLTLSRLTGLPWVADFRDPMTDVDYPPDRLTRQMYQWIEKKSVTYCTKAVLTTPGAVDDYKERFPQTPASRFHLIENGYDEESFAAAEANRIKEQKKNARLVLIHSGIIYPSERDPTQLFEALAVLTQQELISHTSLHVILRATAHDEYLLQLIDQYKIGDIVSLAPPISYREALSEMLAADGLLILQASNCNNQIPAKLYEYLRARRPILALTDPVGNTAAALISVGVDTMAPLDSRNDIMRELLRFLALIKGNEAPIASMENALAGSRRSRTKELSNLLESVAQRAGS